MELQSKILGGLQGCMALESISACRMWPEVKSDLKNLFEENPVWNSSLEKCIHFAQQACLS